MKITSNVAALTAQRNLGKNDSVLEKSIAKLSSGYRLNKASDDAAGMGIANKIRADIRSLMQASRNASQATALVQVAEGAVGTISSILDRMKELATQSASDSVVGGVGGDREKIQAEFAALSAEITRITGNTKYQGQTLLQGGYGVTVASSTIVTGGTTGFSSLNSVTLSGAQASTTYTITATTGGAGTFQLSASMAGGGVTTQALANLTSVGPKTFNFDKLGVTITLDSGYSTVDALTTKTITTSAAAGGYFQVGSDNTGTSQIQLTLGNLTLGGLGITGDLTSLSNAQAALAAIDTAIGNLNAVIGSIGAASNRFDYAIQNLQSIIENMGAAESVIRDADVGVEMTTFTKAQILSQAGTAMLAQANAAPQSVLSLLKG